MFKIAILSCALVFASLASAQTITAGANSTVDTKLMGDVDNGRSQSTSQQINPSANANGNDLGNSNDVRNQNTTSSGATGGSAIGNQSDNKSSASNGNQTLGQVTNGNSTVGPTTSSSTSAGGTASSTGVNAQKQGIAGSGNSKNANTVAGSTNRLSQSTSSGNGNGGNGAAVTVAGSSDSYRSVAWAPIINGPAAPALAAANLVVLPGQCGPRVRVVTSNVVGKQFGPFGGQYDVQQGTDTDTVMAQGADGQYEPYVIIGDDVWGQRVDRAIGALGTSSATNFSVGGFTSKGDAAQGGAGGSGALQQIVARSFVTDCIIGKVIKPVVAIADPVVIPIPVAAPIRVVAQRPRRVHPRKPGC